MVTAMGKRFALAGRLSLRELRSGELTVLLTALIIAVAASTTISLLSDRLNRTLLMQAAEFLAADLVIASHDAAPPEWEAKAAGFQLRHARTVEFSSVLLENEQILLVGAKAVSEAYPLRGRVRTAGDDLAADSETTEIPAPGSVWVERRVLTRLGLALGQSLEIGEKRFRIDRIITREPDLRGDLYSLSPRVMINLADLAATRVIQPGSHVHRYELYAGEETAILRFKDWLKPGLRPGQRLVDVHEDRPEVGNALKRAQRYLGLTTIAVVLIAGAAIAMSVRRYTERHYDMTAMLKCFGVGGRAILGIYALQFLVIGLLGSAIGCLIGAVLQQFAGYLLRDLLPLRLADPSLFGLLFGVVTGLLILFGFALPPILRLGRCTPLRVLRRDLEPAPTSAWLVYGLALGVLGWLLWRATGDVEMSLIILAGGIVTLSVLASVAWLLLGLTRWAAAPLGLSWRFALRSLSHNPKLAVGQTLAFGVTVVAMLLSILVRTELIAEWRQALPKDAPNHFALNLFAEDLDRFRQFFAAEGIRSSAFYPIVRGRLTAVNGEPVERRVSKDSTADAAINRELSLTWSETLPADNSITRGQWWQGGEAGAVSVEAQLAKSLGLRLGDRLSFSVGGQELQARVASFRSVRWDMMTPNFFMMFSPGSLEGHPLTYLTSFYLPEEGKPALNRLVQAFPGVSLLEVDRLLKQFETILQQVSGAIEYLLWFALAAGFTVLFAAVRATLDERIYRDALLRALGAPTRLLRRSLWIEFAGLGFLSGLLAVAVSETITWVLFERVFDLPARPHGWFWLATPLLGALVVGVAGVLNTRWLMRRSPLSLLRDS